jgi:hypothetical protein
MLSREVGILQWAVSSEQLAFSLKNGSEPVIASGGNSMKRNDIELPERSNPLTVTKSACSEHFSV